MTDKIKKSLFRSTVGLSAIVGGLTALGMLYFIPVPEGNREALLLAVGLVLGWGSSVINYEFGSSAGSARKTELLSKGDES